MFRSLIATFVGILGCAPLFCGGCKFPERGDGGVVHVAVTIPPQKWLVSQIGGERVTCVVLIPGNQDPHTFTGTDADAARLARCRVFFSIGLPVENSPWCRAISQQSRLRVVSLSQATHFHTEFEAATHEGEAGMGSGSGGPTQLLHSGSKDPAVNTLGQIERRHNGHDHGEAHEHDAFLHTWLSPRRLIAMGEIVAHTLEEVDPSNRTFYRNNWERLRSQLTHLDEELREKLAPLKGQEFFVYHPAWECFADDYGLVQVAMETQGKEPSDREITELQRRAQRARIKVMLVQPQIASRAARAVAEAAGLRVVTANPLAEDIPTELRRVAESLISAYRESMESADLQK
ncbi:zinc ABC transporter substrate-binding protein [Thermogutta sp.]|uniref:metal ABC transporter solute-binding protein, Zn/Mn family n=1 Tax=Thermogutta sp. TaxID=1962930 RepID=UPI00322047AF